MLPFALIGAGPMGLAEGTAAARNLQRLKRKECGRRFNGGLRYLALDRMAYYVHKEAYLDQVHHHIRELAAKT